MAGSNARAVVDTESLAALVPALRRRGYEVLGPVVRDGAIVYDHLDRTEDLPIGWVDRQEPGQYRLERHDGAGWFSHHPGPQGWKQFLHPAEIRLFSSDPAARYAFIGIRACELAAIRIQDRTLVEDRFPDPVYEARRRDTFFVAVNCTTTSATCFCSSMQTGPRAERGFDLALTELEENGRHMFALEAGSARGAEVLAEFGERIVIKGTTKNANKAASKGAIPASAKGAVQEGANGSVQECVGGTVQEGAKGAFQKIDQRIEQAVDGARQSMRRHVETAGLRELLQDNFEHPEWDNVAQRCLSCGNCTMVCPTCFCTTVEDRSDISGDHTGRLRKWDSCFTQSFSYIHGGSVRSSARSRYRQWLTHKFSSWIDQFGTFGCVGCGRCITWCPAGIDITAELGAIRETAVLRPPIAKEDILGNAGTYPGRT